MSMLFEGQLRTAQRAGIRAQLFIRFSSNGLPQRVTDGLGSQQNRSNELLSDVPVKSTSALILIHLRGRAVGRKHRRLANPPGFCSLRSPLCRESPSAANAIGWLHVSSLTTERGGPLGASNCANLGISIAASHSLVRGTKCQAVVAQRHSERGVTWRVSAQSVRPARSAWSSHFVRVRPRCSELMDVAPC